MSSIHSSHKYQLKLSLPVKLPFLEKLRNDLVKKKSDWWEKLVLILRNLTQVRNFI